MSSTWRTSCSYWSWPWRVSEGQHMPVGLYPCPSTGSLSPLHGEGRGGGLRDYLSIHPCSWGVLWCLYCPSVGVWESGHFGRYRESLSWGVCEACVGCSKLGDGKGQGVVPYKVDTVALPPTLTRSLGGANTLQHIKDL